LARKNSFKFLKSEQHLAQENSLKLVKSEQLLAQENSLKLVKSEQILARKNRVSNLGSLAVSADPDSPPTVLNLTTSGVLLPTEEKTDACTPGVDVMITIFGEKIGVFSRTNVCNDQIFFHNLAMF
jgi:hypothetical protein